MQDSQGYSLLKQIEHLSRQWSQTGFVWIWKSLKSFKGHFLTVRFLFTRKKRAATSGNDQIFVSWPLIHFSWKMKQAVWFVRFSNLSEEGITLVEMKLYGVQVRLLKHTPCKEIFSTVNVSNFFCLLWEYLLGCDIKKRRVSARHLYEVYNFRLLLLFVKSR